VHHNFVSSCEMGDRSLNYVEVRAWCKALDISWLDFTQNVDELLAAVNGENIQGKPFEPEESK